MTKNQASREVFSKSKLKNKISSKQEVVSLIYEELGLFPKSFSRVTDRFLQQIFSDVENLIVHEYRFYKYLVLTTIKSLLILFFVPILVNFFAKNYLVRPLTEYFWNSKQTEIFLNTSQQKQAFLELKDFEEKLYFESFILSKDNVSIINEGTNSKTNNFEVKLESLNENIKSNNDLILENELINLNFSPIKKDHKSEIFNCSIFSKTNLIKNVNFCLAQRSCARLFKLCFYYPLGAQTSFEHPKGKSLAQQSCARLFKLCFYYPLVVKAELLLPKGKSLAQQSCARLFKLCFYYPLVVKAPLLLPKGKSPLVVKAELKDPCLSPPLCKSEAKGQKSVDLNDLEISKQEINYLNKKIKIRQPKLNKNKKILNIKKKILTWTVSDINKKFIPKFVQKTSSFTPLIDIPLPIPKGTVYIRLNYKALLEKKKPPVLKLHEKTIALAIKYNNLSIEALTNVFSDLISFLTLCYLLFALEIQFNITKSFLLEFFFGLEDDKKCLVIFLVTDFLVGYHSSNIWEVFFKFVFDHYGFAESQTAVFLLVATLPVILDILFKYLIFRHLNRASPGTVATYHTLIE